METPDLHLIFN